MLNGRFDVSFSLATRKKKAPRNRVNHADCVAQIDDLHDADKVITTALSYFTLVSQMAAPTPLQQLMTRQESYKC